MPRFSANLSSLFTEVPFLERFAAAAQAGFRGCDVPFPYHYPAEVMGDKAASSGLKLVSFHAPPGNWATGERGLAALPGREDDFRASLEIALSYAEFLECSCIHVMAGIVPETDWDEALDVYCANLRYAAEQFSQEGIKCLVEPISPGVIPGYFLSRPEDAVNLLEDINHDNLYILYDIYHAQMVQGGLTDFIEMYRERIAHIQVAGVPGRHEPDQLGEVNFRYIFDLLDSSGYDGWVGCAYTPRGETRSGLQWVRSWLDPCD